MRAANTRMQDGRIREHEVAGVIEGEAECIQVRATLAGVIGEELSRVRRRVLGLRERQHDGAHVAHPPRFGLVPTAERGGAEVVRAQSSLQAHRWPTVGVGEDKKPAPSP